MAIVLKNLLIYIKSHLREPGLAIIPGHLPLSYPTIVFKIEWSQTTWPA